MIVSAIMDSTKGMKTNEKGRVSIAWHYRPNCRGQDQLRVSQKLREVRESTEPTSQDVKPRVHPTFYITNVGVNPPPPPPGLRSGFGVLRCGRGPWGGDRDWARGQARM
jgi:hypothetical protein